MKIDANGHIGKKVDDKNKTLPPTSGHVMTQKIDYFTLSSAFSDWSIRNKISSFWPVNNWTTSNTLKPFKVLSKSNWSVKIKKTVSLQVSQAQNQHLSYKSVGVMVLGHFVPSLFHWRFKYPDSPLIPKKSRIKLMLVTDIGDKKVPNLRRCSPIYIE